MCETRRHVKADANMIAVATTHDNTFRTVLEHLLCDCNYHGATKSNWARCLATSK